MEIREGFEMGGKEREREMGGEEREIERNRRS